MFCSVERRKGGSARTAFTTEFTEGRRETAGEDDSKPAVLLVAADGFAKAG
jgi:hypothetical protein